MSKQIDEESQEQIAKLIAEGAIKAAGPVPELAYVEISSEMWPILNGWFRNLEGRIKTILECAIANEVQAAAAKNLVSNAIWHVYNMMADELAGCVK